MNSGIFRRSNDFFFFFLARLRWVRKGVPGTGGGIVYGTQYGPNEKEGSRKDGGKRKMEPRLDTVRRSQSYGDFVKEVW